MASYRFGRLTPEVAEMYIAKRDQLGFTGNGADSAVIAWLLENSEVDPSVRLTPAQIYEHLHYDDKEQEEIQMALDSGRVTLSELLRVGLLAQARRTNSATTQFDQIDLSDSRSRHGRRGGAMVYLESLMPGLLEKSTKEHWYVSKSFVMKETGIGRDTIIAYFEKNQEMIEAHNRNLGFKTEIDGTNNNRNKMREYNQGAKRGGMYQTCQE